MKGDHSRPQSELVGAPWAGPGAAAALQRPHPSPGPHSDALGDRRPWGVARRSRGGGAPQCQPPTHGDLNATSPPSTRPRRHPCAEPVSCRPLVGGVASKGQRGWPWLTLQACPSSRAALWASAGFSITLPVCPEKSIATREFSETLRCRDKATSAGTARPGAACRPSRHEARGRPVRDVTRNGRRGTRKVVF